MEKAFFHMLCLDLGVHGDGEEERVVWAFTENLRRVLQFTLFLVCF